MVTALGYVVVRTPRLDEWRRFAHNLVGLQEEDVRNGELIRLRMDGKVQRLLLQQVMDGSGLTMGFEVSDADGLAALRRMLEAAGYEVRSGTDEELQARGVVGMLCFRDPDGNRIEIAHGLREAESAFRPGRPIGGFRTGELGIGHVALTTDQFSQMRALYRDLLGFRLTDYAVDPFPIEFYRVNARHHTVGLADAGTGPGLYHLMLEYNEWDDVGRAYDMAMEQPGSIGVSLGRHLNDRVTSFYVKTPDGWLLELGWASRLIDDAHWQVQQVPALSLWGHERYWLPEDLREKARAQRRALAEQGVRAPVEVPARDAQLPGRAPAPDKGWKELQGD